MKRFFALLLAGLLLLCACGRGEDGGDRTDSPASDTASAEPVTEHPQPGVTVALIRDGKPQYTIFCGNSAYLSYAESLQDKLFEKYGIAFPLSRRVGEPESRPCIVIGQTGVTDAGIYSDLTYSGYAVKTAGAHLYVCGYNTDTVGKAVQYWLSTMTKSYATRNAEGKVSVTLPDATLFVRNPKYLKPDCTLFGRTLSGYRLVLPADSGETERNLAENFQREIGINTGAYLPVLADTEAETEPEIRIGRVTRASSAALYPSGADTFARGDFRVESSGTTVSVGYNGAGALYAALNLLLTDCYNSRTEAYSLTSSLKASYLGSQPLDLTDGADIRIMSINTLFANGHIKGSRFTDRTRIEVIGDYCLAFLPDSVGLQECIINNNVKYLDPVISEVYAWVPYDAVTSGEKTLYRKDKYELKDHNIIDLGNNYAFQWALLEDKATHEQYIHGNVHYHYNTDADRLPQAEQVNAELKRVTEK